MPDMWAPALPLPDAKMASLKLTWDMILYSRYLLKQIVFGRAYRGNDKTANARQVCPCIGPSRRPQIWALEIDQGYTF